jgi:hypothetical protein
MQFSISKSGRFAVLLGTFLSSVAFGCVITVGDGGKASSECPDQNSYLKDNKCFCDIGYDWCNPSDDADLSCCDNGTSASSVTNNTGGTTSDTATGTGTATGGTTGGSTTEEPPTTSQGTTGAPVDCSSTASVPESCDPNSENFLCVQADNPDCGPEGSKYYVCDGGTWAEDPTGPTGQCTADGFDFAYGCTDNGTMIEFVCGNGSGTACSGDTKSCNGDTNLEFCQFGKLGTQDCLVQCMDVGDDMGVTYDFGYCGDQGSGSQCICCDEGDRGCPLGGGTTGGTTGGSTGGSTGG